MELIAHRGASAVAPESTRAAIDKAIRAGAAMIELDVQMTQDGVPVIFHDERLERTTDGCGSLRAKTYRQLRLLDSGSWFGKRFSGQKILSVAEVFRIMPRRVAINLELKRSPKREVLQRRLLGILRKHPSKSVLISSFDSSLLGFFGSRHYPCAVISSRLPGKGLNQAIRLGCEGWHARDNIISRKMVQEAHGHNLKVRVWTVDHIKRARQLKRWGVDGVFTNDPSRLKKAAA